MYKLTFVNEHGNIVGKDNKVMFNINKEKRKIACIMHVKVNGLPKYLDYNGDDDGFPGNYNLERYIIDRLVEYHYINPKYYDLERLVIQLVGVATCDENDTFNETIGKRIAESRARLEAYTLMERINKFCEEYICFMKLRLNLAEEKTSFLKSREIDHIRKLVQET